MVFHRISSWVVDLQLFMTSSRGQNLLLLKMGRDHIFNGVLIPLKCTLLTRNDFYGLWILWFYVMIGKYYWLPCKFAGLRKYALKSCDSSLKVLLDA